MVYLLGLLGAGALGVGYVLQQRVAAQASADVLHARLIVRLLHARMWWLGTLAIVGGQLLGAGAFVVGDVAVVEPLLSLSLLVALAVAAGVVRHAPRWQELLGALLLTATLAVFLAVSARSASRDARTDLLTVAIGTVAVFTLAGALVVVARGRRAALEGVLLATAAGVLYGLQDVATRGTSVVADRHGFAAWLTSPYPYLTVATGVAGVVLAQNAFGAARLDYSLPPSTATEPVVAIGLGVGLLGEQLAVSAGALAIDACCFAALVGSVALIGRSPAWSSVTSVDRPARSPRA
ncbi:DMT family transporter [uncultured Jatrophihabitans sp.]|uniref:DMT family transporter n=1 Tax=uncultured Jatrophihabitans sp. TaxID=1610747 RepID=UPI0035CBA61B